MKAEGTYEVLKREYQNDIFVYIMVRKNSYYNVTGRTSPSQKCDLEAFLYQPTNYHGSINSRCKAEPLAQYHNRMSAKTCQCIRAASDCGGLCV